MRLTQTGYLSLKLVVSPGTSSISQTYGGVEVSEVTVDLQAS